VALLLVTNFVGHGRFGISPYGAVFGLARLVADGPAKDYLEESCPDSGYRMCDWTGRFPSDADTFMWSPSGPVWTFPGGPIALAPEASRIVAATVMARPWAVASAAYGNTLTQIVTLQLDTVIGGAWLDETVGAQLHAYYPAAEENRFKANEQRSGGLRVIAAPFQTAQLLLLPLAAIASGVLMVRSWRRDRKLFALIAMIAAGLLSNAFATGALSGPHDRYQARIAWLVLLPPALFLMGGRSTANLTRAPVSDEQVCFDRGQATDSSATSSLPFVSGPTSSAMM
jgi:hypothetical protein